MQEKNIALETDKTLSDTTATKNGYNKTQSEKGFASLVKERILSDRKNVTPENDYAVSHNRSGKDESFSPAVENEDRSTAVLQAKHKRFVAEGTVAFSAMKVARQDHVGANQNIIFEQVLTNEGGGYHQNHGVFIAPQSGVFVFSSTIMCVPNGEVDAEMVHNGNGVTHIYCHGDGGSHDQGSQTVVIKMNAGDEVAVRNFAITDNSIWGGLYSSFSGYLVWLQ
ncbi:hypothetical protein DPMN_057457 [Dreissena polymorpha]|uniref:C1q domain-containing protein n=2 Tax=Dreissena polymorpha TaxID=45954 RepID=A0A9D4C005_DREPO|nr:hypothetical protein DPMN_057457 [Dreissena polymorpha]